MGCCCGKSKNNAVIDDTEMAHEQTVPEFKPKKGDVVEETLAELSKKYNVHIQRKGSDLYLLGTKAVAVSQRGTQVMARVGGGWQPLDEILKKISEAQKKGLKTMTTSVLLSAPSEGAASNPPSKSKSSSELFTKRNSISEEEEKGKEKEKGKGKDDK